MNSETLGTDAVVVLNRRRQPALAYVSGMGTPITSCFMIKADPRTTSTSARLQPMESLVGDDDVLRDIRRMAEGYRDGPVYPLAMIHTLDR
jgi:hypothetical protein